ncbi:MAG: TRAP transporter substrate-binding protein DctP [Chromatiales bacterium]|nr:TRAP transporter substrate-binding protein DctP [Chromatiales bacterium]
MKLRTCTPKLAVVILLACLPLGIHATELKLATIAPEGSAWMKDLRTAGLQIRERTGGRVNIKFYGGGIQGTDKKVLRKIRIGQLQGGVFTSNSLEERYPDILIYGLPMLFNSQDEVDYVRQKLDAKLTAGLEKAGFVSYGFAGGGFAYFMTGKPVAGLADLRGQKIWVPEGDQTSYVAMQALQLSPVVLPITDVLTGLETGLLDIVATPPVGAVILQWYTKTRFVTNLPLSYTLGVLAIDKGALEGVSDADRAVIREVMTALYARLDAQNRIDNAKAEQALRANGLKFVEPNAAEVPEWRAAVSAAMDAMAAKGTFSAGLLAEVRGHLQEYRKARPVAGVSGARP